MKNLVFLTGAISGLHEESEGRYSFVLTAYKGDKADDVFCMCNLRCYGTAVRASETGEEVTISGLLKSYRNDNKSVMFIGVNDAMIALPFTEDENTVTADGYVASTPKVFANRTVCFIKVHCYADKWAWIPSVAYNNVGRRLAMLDRNDNITVSGYATYDGITSQLVITDFETKGERNETTESDGRELQRENVRYQSVPDYVHKGRKPMWKNNGYGRSVRHSHREDVRRQFS